MTIFAESSSSFSVCREMAGLSLSDVSSEMGVPLSVVKDWESGARVPPEHVTSALRVLGEMGSGDSSDRKASNVKTRLDSTPLKSDNKPSRKTLSKGNRDLIKSKKRVADHGEVFTPPWLVEKMLDLVKGETERIDSRFLEPACGSGNFLVPILQRKLAAVEAKYGKSEFEKRHYALLALSSLYGIELLADNIAECRANMLDVFSDYLGLEAVDVTYLAASHILSLNLIHGDAMSMKDVTGGPITVVEWAYLGKGKFNRRDFRLETLTKISGFRESAPLFAQAGKHEIFQPRKTYPPMTIKQLSAFEGEGFE